MFAEQSTHRDTFEWNARTIRALRAYLGWSQSTLARDLGIRQQTVSEWETAMYKPRGASVTILSLLARTAGFSASAAGRVERDSDRPGRPVARRSAAPHTGLLAAGPAPVAPRALQGVPGSPLDQAASASDPGFVLRGGGGGQAAEEGRLSPPTGVHSYSGGEEVPM